MYNDVVKYQVEQPIAKDTDSHAYEVRIIIHHAYFIDDQRIGPYALWHHQHHFREVDGGVEMQDAVTYAVPFGLLGKLAHRVFVRGQLRGIFSHRRSVLEKRFKADLKEKEVLL